MFARILATGDVIIHTPDALVHHRHRVDEASLDKQIRGNGSGMAALLTKAIIEKPSVLCTLVGRIPGILKRIKPGGARVAGRDDDTPGSLTRSEIKGSWRGPSSTCLRAGATGSPRSTRLRTRGRRDRAEQR